MQGWNVLVATLAAYALGCISTAYYIVRVLKGQDIRTLGSGNAGGRNAGRVLGRGGFAAVAVLDAVKGLAAVLLARWLAVPEWGMVAVLLAVVAGHIWPVQLGFRGGKGIATTLGALLTYNWPVPFMLVGIMLLLYALLRSITLALMAAFALLPLLLLALGWPLPAVAACAALAVIVIYANRSNIRARLPGRARTDAS